MRLNKKRILVTGGGSGIGLEIARRLANTNDVVIAGRSMSKLHTAQSANPHLRVAQLDVTSEASARRLVQWLRSELGGLDVLVNNAGILRGGSVWLSSDGAGAVEEIETNLGGPIRMTRLALPLLAEALEAAIVFVSSAVALAATPGYSVYAATKAGLHSYARSLRAELRTTSVRVFEALPPVVDTDMAKGIDGSKLPASKAAEAIVAGLGRNKEQIAIARVRPLLLMARLTPHTADDMVQRAMRQTTPKESRV
jgi:short-subunit dehydrogenase involved in D-alanine esterification of teichoic acids